MATTGIGTILGGLPVWVVISAGKDADTPNGPGEHWAEVEAIHWLKRDKTPGREIPDSVRDRALRYDYGFCNLIEGIFEQKAYEQSLADDAAREMVAFDAPMMPA